MNYNQLSLDQAPEIWTPLRFFISAPLFAMAALILLLISGPEILQNRWYPQTLAITHLITLGFISMVMVGAMFQLLPVLAGAEIYRSKLSSKVIHLLLFMGIILFCTGMAFSISLLLKLGVLLLIPGLLVFLILVSIALLKAKSNFASATGMRFAISAFWVVLLLGGILSAGTAWDSLPLLRELTNIHIIWAALGWVLMMVVAISYQVIPMFQVTHEYPERFKQTFFQVLFLCLIILSVVIYKGLSQTIITAIISGLIVTFSVISMKLLWQRKKRLMDASVYYWFTGLIALIFSVLIFQFENNFNFNFNLSLGVLMGVVFFSGFVMSVINGMIFRIVPFLVWLHLNKKLAFTQKGLSAVPTMNEVISRKKMLYQYYLHITSLILTLLSFVMPVVFFYPAVLLWLMSLGLLFIYLLQAVRLYYNCINESASAN
jgi:hypothetical protein